MFKKSRSKRANKNAALAQATPPTAAAAIAALQAASTNPQDERLAAGAAAAALRSHTTSPVPVSETQTRRMIRRSSFTSNGSDVSAAYAQAQGRLSRSGSVSSMTSRTFRSPSPHGVKPVPEPTPPVPALPSSASRSSGSMASRSFRRPASTEPPARTLSPTPRKGVRNMSADTWSRQRPEPVRTDSGSRNSINFSRPMSPDILNASPSSPTARSFANQLADLEQKFEATANQSVKKRRDLESHEGSHLAAGTMGTRTHGTAYDPYVTTDARLKRIPLPRRISEEPENESEFEEVFDPHTRTMIKRRKPGFKPRKAPEPVQKRTLSPQKRDSPARSAERPIPTSAPLSTSTELPQPKSREASISPARQTRFSLKPTEGKMHEPARSLTPTKSALRKSPSPRSRSPADSNSNRTSLLQPGFSPGDASDSASTPSEDRSKRRSFRVSFDDQPTIVGTSVTAPNGADSPPALSPQHDKKKGWFGLRKKPVPDQGEEQRLAPTPALPSFGSIRGQRPAAEEYEKQPLSTVLGIPGVALTTGEKTPSEAGSHTEDMDNAVKAPIFQPAADASTPNVDGSAMKIGPTDVPMIAVVPGTPGVEEVHNSMDTTEDSASSPVSDTSPAAAGLAEPEPEEAAIAHDPATPVVGHVAEAIHKQSGASGRRGSNDSQDSHYSDAAEDVDGDGFGSINAIIEKPVTESDSPKKTMAEAIPPFAEAAPPEIAPVPAAEAAQGDEATTFREVKVDPPASLADAGQDLPQDGTAVEQSDAPSTPERRPSVEDISPKTREKMIAMGWRPPTSSGSLNETAESRKQELTKQETTNVSPATAPAQVGRKPLKSAMKQSNRNSMIYDTRSSVETRAALQKKPRPMSIAAPASPQGPQSDAVVLAKAMLKVQESRRAEATTHEMSAEATLAQARARAGLSPPRQRPTALRRRSSDASDSSFKRGPSSVASDGGRITMRRSMRATPPARPQSVLSSGSFRGSMYESPSQRSRPTSMAGGGFASRTMRQPSRDPSPTRSVLSFKKSGKALPAAGGRRQNGLQYDDSSDDEPVVPMITTRYEARRSTMRPNGTNSRPAKNLESSDSDSDAEQTLSTLGKTPPANERLMELARQRLGIEARPDVPPLEEPTSPGLLSQSDLVTAFAGKEEIRAPKRMSIFGTLSRRKTRNSKLTAAQRDALLEKSAMHRQNLDGQPSPVANSGSMPERPPVARQTTAERAAVLREQINPNSWPIPESTGAEKYAIPRPDTSDGSPAPSFGRPGLQRNVSSQSAPIYGRGGKKKRFPMLRRAFGLHD